MSLCGSICGSKKKIFVLFIFKCDINFVGGANIKLNVFLFQMNFPTYNYMHLKIIQVILPLLTNELISVPIKICMSKGNIS